MYDLHTAMKQTSALSVWPVRDSLALALVSTYNLHLASYVRPPFIDDAVFSSDFGLSKIFNVSASEDLT